MTSLPDLGGPSFRTYIERFRSISARLERIDFGAERRKAAKILRATVRKLKALKRHDESEIGAIAALLEERIPILEREETEVQLEGEFRTLAHDLAEHGIPDEAWPSIRILASQHTSLQQKLNEHSRLLRVKLPKKGGQRADYRRHVAVILAAEVYETHNGVKPTATEKFVDFCQDVFVELGMDSEKDAKGLEDLVKRIVRDGA